MQPFILGGDAVHALALHASSELKDAISTAFCDNQCAPEADESMPDSSALEEAHLSVLVSDLDPLVAREQYDFLVRPGPRANAVPYQCWPALAMQG